MVLSKANSGDLSRLADFYKYVTDNTENMSLYCRWIYGLHPSYDLIEGYIEAGAMYYVEINGEIVSAAAVTTGINEDYANVNWRLPFTDSEAGVVHVFCVHPGYQKRGFAKKVMALIEGEMRKLGKRVVRLDALEANTPARKMYESIGYKHVETQSWYASNFGTAQFCLYEKSLDSAVP